MKPHIVRHKGRNWLVQQWFGQTYIWGMAPTLKEAWEQFQEHKVAFL